MRTFALTICVVMSGLRPLSADEIRDRPVARVGKRTITHREIDCAIHTKRLAQSAGEQRQEESVAMCLQQERQRLTLLITEELLDAAIRKFGLTSSAEDLASDAATHGYDEREFARLSEYYRGLARAALLVRGGEALHLVYERDVASSYRIPEMEFRRFLELIPTADAATQFIERHTPEHFRNSIEGDAFRRIGKKRLRQLLSNEAARRDVPFAMHAETFWRELVAEIGVEILDRRYNPLPLQELSWEPENASTP